MVVSVLLQIWSQIIKSQLKCWHWLQKAMRRSNQLLRVKVPNLKKRSWKCTRPKRNFQWSKQNHSRDAHSAYHIGKRRNCKKLVHKKLEERNMAWVPKGNNQKKSDVQGSIARSATKVKKEKSENYERPSRRFQHLWSTHYPYSSTMPRSFL